jgi:15-cis-phytoene synthase
MSSSRRNHRLTGAKTTNFYYSFVFLPRDKRRALEAVYAFARRGDDLVDGSLPPAEAREALARYQADLAAFYSGGPAAARPAGAELAALADAVKRFQIPRAPFDDLIRGLEMDLSISRYATFADLEIYCYRVASTIGLIAIEIFGYRNPATRDYAVHLGKALQVVNILRDVRHDARRGRIYLPIEDLERFEVCPESLLDGRPQGRFRELVEFEATRARSFFDLARRALPAEDRRSMLAAEIMAATYWRLLGRIRRRGETALEPRVRLSRPIKIWTALSVYLSAGWPR